MKGFNDWLDILINEKGIDVNETFEVEKGTFDLMEYGYVIEAIKHTSKEEQLQIKNMLVKIDFLNGSITNYLKHLAKALV